MGPENIYSVPIRTLFQRYSTFCQEYMKEGSGYWGAQVMITQGHIETGGLIKDGHYRSKA